MALKVREAISRDEMEVSRLWRRCGLVKGYNDPGSDFRFACMGPASTVLVGAEEGRIIGTVMVGHDGHRGWLYYVACSPDRQIGRRARDGGVGRRLAPRLRRGQGSTHGA